ncbi:hypothetical protein BGZ76_006490 [Entomortierella beljakovae]|nr:hypothetical protein BGZ76_006490 [Entomortierella beljakovae]
MATIENFPKFLSMNYIWGTSVRPKSLPQDIHNTICQDFIWPRSMLPEDISKLCQILNDQLADGLDLQIEDMSSKAYRSLLVFYESLALKLPMKYLSFKNGIEDTYCHGIIDALFTRQFSVRSAYDLEWANKEANGSKERRDNGYKPDAIISKDGKELAFVEIKPPKEDRSMKLYLKDQWKLANYCKDNIDMYLRHGIRITESAAIQIFGKDITFLSVFSES